MKSILRNLLISGTTVITLGTVGIVSYLNSQGDLDSLKEHKKIQITFDNNKLENEVDNKLYNSINNSYRMVDSQKGNGFNSKGDYFKIPFSESNINKYSDLTVSFLLKWGGQDNIFPISTNVIGLYMYNGNIGFNTGGYNRDMYGVPIPFKIGELVHISAVIDSSNFRNSKLYINGVLQNIRDLTSIPLVSSSNAGLGEDIYFGGYHGQGGNYAPSDSTMIDEVHVYQKKINDSEADSLADKHQVPTLKGELLENKHTKLSWTSEILAENLFFSTSFEDYDEIPYFPERPLVDYGGQSIVSEKSFSGNKSLKVENTKGGKGNYYFYPNTSTDYSYLQFPVRKYGREGSYITMSMRVKNESDYRFQPMSLNDVQNITIDLHEKHKFANPIIFTKDAPIGTTTFYVSNVSQIESYVKRGGTIWVAQRTLKVNDGISLPGISEMKSYDVENSTITLKSPLNQDYKAGDVVQSHLQIAPIVAPERGASISDKWELYNINMKLNGGYGYDTEKRGFVIELVSTVKEKAYIDDFEIGYSTKTRLYRDGIKIYDGYNSEYIDNTAVDKAKPDKVSTDNININVQSNKDNTRGVEIDFKDAVDNGSKYIYRVSSVSNGGVETALSESVQIDITSGIKGYSYIINNNSTTIPDDVIDISNTKINHSIKDYDTYYLHIKAIDNDGNPGGTIHYKIDIPILRAEAKPLDNLIRLDWTLDNRKDKTFKVYQKKEGSNEFQSISTTNLSKNRQVRVLNIYPYKAGNTANIDESFETWDGESLTLPKSAALKRWMEEPNEMHPKGFGQGIIEVDPVELKEFDSNPDKYLKNSDGSYKYDVITIGFWDSNATS